MPAGYEISLSEFYGTGIASGFLFSAANPTAPYMGAAIDVSQHFILPISLENSSVSALF